MDWTPSYYVLSALAAGVVIVVLVFAAAKLRMRLLWFAAIGLAGVASGIVYVVQHDARLELRPRINRPPGFGPIRWREKVPSDAPNLAPRRRMMRERRILPRARHRFRFRTTNVPRSGAISPSMPRETGPSRLFSRHRSRRPSSSATEGFARNLG